MKLIILISFINLISLFNFSNATAQCQIANNNERLDCYPESGANQDSCIARGCCWSEPMRLSNKLQGVPLSIPYCYYPTDYSNYMIKSLRKSSRGIKAKLVRESPSYLPYEVAMLDLEVIYETKSRTRVRITDPKQKRYEVPMKLSPPDLKPPTDREYEVIIPSDGSFSIEIKRKSDDRSLFKSFGPLLYSDQFLQISSIMSTDQIYGIGEQNRPFLHQLSNGWERIGLWARDNPIETFMNLYGAHPFYIGMPDDGKAFGVFHFNSNGQEFALQPAPAVTYRTIGGILDFFIFTGGSPEETVKQYLELVGKPMLPPYWSLGFHLSKYGYKDIKEIHETLQRNVNSGISVDVQWSDIDYMDGYKDFSVDNQNYQNFGEFVKQIRDAYNTRYISIIDPAISNQNTDNYSPYTDGLEMDIFIKNPDTNEPIIGEVWPGKTVFPDFTHPDITKYWSKQIRAFHDMVPVDGLWIDMNDPSSFVDGSTTGCSNNNRYDRPFFVPEIRDQSLIAKTICSSSLHYNKEKHYNLHNIYGFKESVVTNDVLLQIFPKKRPFLLSRSTFSGSGKYAFHWTGDNQASWDHLRNSIRQVLNFNMFGIPMTGADICGFNGNSDEELCIRWMQLGAFYPFMRNHNAINQRDQDPASWNTEAQKIMKTAISNRYAMLPLFYTLLVKSHMNGGTVMRPMSFEFFSDKVTHSIELQFMIGSSIMATPVVYPGARSVDAYFPAGVWYDFHSGKLLHSDAEGAWLTLDAPLDKINIALRGGHIVPLLDSNRNSKSNIPNKMTLYCGMAQDMSASGDLYWDDGESIDSYSRNRYSYVSFNASPEQLLITPVYFGYDLLPVLNKIVILGFENKSITKFLLNDNDIPFHYNPETSSVVLSSLNANLNSEIKIQWM